MALLKYLKVIKKTVSQGPLSGYLSSDAIWEVNNEVSSLVSKEASKCMPYIKATSEQKAIIGKYTAENGIINFIRHSQKNFRLILSKRAQCVVEKFLPTRATNEKAIW